MTGLIVYILAVYGVSSLLTSYDGLYAVFLRLRNKYPNSALKCMVCTSVWASLVLFIPILLGIGFIILTPLAAIGAIILIKELME